MDLLQFLEYNIINNNHISNITNILKNSNVYIEGNIVCDIKADYYTIKKNIIKILNLQYLAKNKKKICEIGVNAGHSLLLMLLVNPTADYLLFDLNTHAYTEPCINYIKNAFPDANIKIIYGDSVETIKTYITENKDDLNTYDLCHIDGGHTEDVFSNDFYNVKQLIEKDGIVIFDDYDYMNIKNFIDSKVIHNEIIEIDDKNIYKTCSHFLYKHIS